MSKFVKTAIAATMVMGAFASTSTIAAGNNGTARFYGTIEDSPCSIVPDDHKLEVDMGDVGSGILKNNGTSTPKAFQIHLPDPLPADLFNGLLLPCQQTGAISPSVPNEIKPVI